MRRQRVSGNASDPRPQLRSIRFRAHEADTYPFDTPVIKTLLGDELTFDGPVTVLAGENGSGKSTLLEAIACAIDAVAVGSQEVSRDASLEAGRSLAALMTPVWSPVKRTHRGFFLRAEDFFGYALRIDRTRAELKAQRAELMADETISNVSTARGSIRIRTEKRSWNSSASDYSRAGFICSMNRKRHFLRRASSRFSR